MSDLTGPCQFVSPGDPAPPPKPDEVSIMCAKVVMLPNQGWLWLKWIKLKVPILSTLGSYLTYFLILRNPDQTVHRIH